MGEAKASGSWGRAGEAWPEQDAVTSIRTGAGAGHVERKLGRGTPSFILDWPPPGGQGRGSANTVITVPGICRDILNSHRGWPGSLVVGCMSCGLRGVT